MDHNLQKYLAFIACVETGSFSKAAEKLNFAQSSISKMISDLEKDCGMVLMERDRNGIHLTGNGEELLPYARKIAEACHGFQTHVDDLNGTIDGTIRTGTVASIAINFLPDVFARFHRDYPGIRYEMLLGEYDEIENWLSDGRIDIGLLRLPSRKSFDTIFLFQNEYLAVLPVDHPLARKKTVDIRDFEGLPFILLENGGKTEVSALLEEAGDHPDIRLSTWEDFAVMAMVEKGLAVSILASNILERIPYHIAIRPLEKPYYRRLGAAVKDIRECSPAVRKFLEYLKMSAAPS